MNRRRRQRCVYDVLEVFVHFDAPSQLLHNLHQAGRTQFSFAPRSKFERGNAVVFLFAFGRVAPI
jgi:hypothetical protein